MVVIVPLFDSYIWLKSTFNEDFRCIACICIVFFSKVMAKCTSKRPFGAGCGTMNKMNDEQLPMSMNIRPQATQDISSALVVESRERESKNEKYFGKNVHSCNMCLFCSSLCTTTVSDIGTPIHRRGSFSKWKKAFETTC